jgi:uncharacterized protein YbjT (DUF2867 family)
MVYLSIGETMVQPVVTVVGASGALGSQIAKELLAKGARVRALVRPTTDRSKLESLGVTDFVTADLRDSESLGRALAAEPRSEAVVASAAGFSAHSARTKGDNSKTDTDGYRSLVDATRAAGIPRFVLISILECDQAPQLPHFAPKLQTEMYLQQTGQPYLSLRAAAFLDRAQDVVAPWVRRGRFPDVVPGVAMDMIYSKDLARYAAQAALDLPTSVLNQCVDVCCDRPVSGPEVASAFAKVLGRPVKAKAFLPAPARLLLPVLRPFVSGYLRDQIDVWNWIRRGGYVSRNRQKQAELFGPAPRVEDAVARYCRDRGLC